jgi:hypothetical protein
MKFPYPSVDRLLTAIAYVPGANPEFKKFRNTTDNARSIGRLCDFIKNKWPQAQHVNLYYRDSRKFKERIELQ